MSHDHDHDHHEDDVAVRVEAVEALLVEKGLLDLEVVDEIIEHYETKRVRKDGFALDDEEFLPGLLCIAALVPSENGPSNLCVAVQAPVMRLDVEKAKQFLPALQRAAQALARIDADADAERTLERRNA